MKDLLSMGQYADKTLTLMTCFFYSVNLYMHMKRMKEI